MNTNDLPMSDPQEQTPWDQIKAVVVEMLTIYGVKFTDEHSREVAIESWASQFHHAADHAALQKERDIELERATHYRDKWQQAEAAVQRLQQENERLTKERDAAQAAFIAEYETPFFWKSEALARKQEVTHLQQALAQAQQAATWVLNTAAYPEQCRDGEAVEALTALEHAITDSEARLQSSIPQESQ